MTDLIKREDAIKAIEDLPNAYNGWSEAYDKAYIIGTLEEVPCAKMDGEYIRREDAVKASWKALYDYQDEMETKFRESDDVEFGDWFIHRIFVQGVHGEILNRIVDIPSAEHLIYEEMEKADIEAQAYAKGFKEGLEARKQGEWERIPYSMADYGRRCSLCHFKVGNPTNFCPNCGARMVK